jgi:hypothetical protein
MSRRVRCDWSSGDLKSYLGYLADLGDKQLKDVLTLTRLRGPRWAPRFSAWLIEQLEMEEGRRADPRFEAEAMWLPGWWTFEDYALGLALLVMLRHIVGGDVSALNRLARSLAVQVTCTTPDNPDRLRDGAIDLL